MAWQDVQPIVGGSANAKGRVRYKVSLRFGCTVTVPEAVVAACGWKPGERLRLSVGGGELFGKLKLAPDPAGLPVLQKGKAQSFMIKLGRWSQLPAREVDRIAVEHQVEGRALVITLPSHALAVMPSSLAGVVAPRASAAPAGKVDVTERVAGRSGGGGVAMAAGTRTGGR